MKNSICFILIIFCFSKIVIAQTPDYSDIRKNGVFIEVYPYPYDKKGMPLGYVSVNYERVLGKKKRALLGLGIYPDFETDYTYIAFPITISMITHPLKKHHLEYGLGIAPTFSYDENNTKKLNSDVPFSILTIGYRYQKNEGLIIRVGYTLIVGWETVLDPSISIGYKF